MPDTNLPSLLRNPFARVLTAVLLVQAAVFYYAARGEKRTELPHPLKQFSRTIGDWKTAQESEIEPEVQAVLRADDTVSRWYARPDGSGVNLFVAFFKTQRTGQSPHSPKNCLPGSGWVPSSTGYFDVPIPATGETIHINRYVVAKGDNKSVVLYWYQTPHRVIANEFEAKFYLVADSIRFHRSDTSMVRVVVPVINGNDEAATRTGVQFIQQLYPELRAYLPN